MTFALSYHPDVPALLAQPRLFLGPQIPGYVSEAGNVLLPMTLDGRMTDTGVRNVDIRGMDRFLQKHEDRFVCESPRLNIYSSRGFYEAAVRPSWLSSVVTWIEDDWLRYRSVLDSHPMQSTALQTVKGQMASLKLLLSACLYLGHDGGPDSENFLYPHDLALYGRPVDVRRKNLFPVLDLLKTFLLTHEQIRTGVAEKIVVERGNAGATIHDIDHLTATHGTFMEFALRQGDMLALRRDDVRPTVTVSEDEEGNLDPTELQAGRIHAAYRSLHDEFVQRISVFLGFVLLIHYQIDGCLMDALCRRLESAGRIGTMASAEHLQFVLEGEMYELGHNLSRDEQGFEGRCLLSALQALTNIQ
ncbi:MAG TPA: hypothetical protein VFX30_14335 [bacterium]|nr:hypothetical protein [bacterium]